MAQAAQRKRAAEPGLGRARHDPRARIRGPRRRPRRGADRQAPPPSSPARAAPTSSRTPPRAAGPPDRRAAARMARLQEVSEPTISRMAPPPEPAASRRGRPPERAHREAMPQGCTGAVAGRLLVVNGPSRSRVRLAADTRRIRAGGRAFALALGTTGRTGPALRAAIGLGALLALRLGSVPTPVPPTPVSEMAHGLRRRAPPIHDVRIRSARPRARRSASGERPAPPVPDGSTHRPGDHPAATPARPGTAVHEAGQRWLGGGLSRRRCEGREDRVRRLRRGSTGLYRQPLRRGRREGRRGLRRRGRAADGRGDARPRRPAGGVPGRAHGGRRPDPPRRHRRPESRCGRGRGPASGAGTGRARHRLRLARPRARRRRAGRGDGRRPGRHRGDGVGASEGPCHATPMPLARAAAERLAPRPLRARLRARRSPHPSPAPPRR